MGAWYAGCNRVGQRQRYRHRVAAVLTIPFAADSRARPEAWLGSSSFGCHDLPGDRPITHSRSSACTRIARFLFAAIHSSSMRWFQTFQAQILAGGHLWLPTPTHPEFVSELNIIDWGGKTTPISPSEVPDARVG